MAYRNTRLGTAVSRRGRRSRYPHEPPKIPIIDASRRIVGWTSVAPEACGARLRHLEAESLTGGPVEAVYIELHSLADAVAAGAPLNWREPWRCLALAPEGTRTDSINMFRNRTERQGAKSDAEDGPRPAVIIRPS